MINQGKQSVVVRKITNSGITMIALIVTIVVLLILAGITLGGLTGENGLIGNSKEAKEQTEIANEKEIIEQATTEAMGKEKYGNLTKQNLEQAVNSIIGEGKAEVEDTGEVFEVYFVDSKRYYEVDKDGNVGNFQIAIQDDNPGDITKGGTLDGSLEHPYEINCIEDLVALSNITSGTGIKLVNGQATQITQAKDLREKYVVLKRNLNFKSKYSYINSERTDFGDINNNSEDGNKLITEMTTGRGFKPINNFLGEFDGKGNKIDNLYINYEDETDITNYYGIGTALGLFGRGNISYTVIKNLEISGNVEGKGHTGGIIAEAAKLIENCINRANVTGFNMVGGISGIDVANISNCKNYGEVSTIGRAYASGGCGGIIGNMSKEQIENCQNYGNICIIKEATVTGAGGVIGYLRKRS